LATAAVLQVYSLGLPGATVSLLLMQLVYALRLPSIRIRAGLLLLPVATVSGAILRAPLGMRGIAFAHVCAMTVLAVYLARAVRPWLADEVYAGLSSYVVRVSAAAAAAYASAAGVLLALGWQLDASALQTTWIVGVAAAAALVVFAGACDVLRIGEVRQGVQALLQPLPMRFRGPQ
jgi:peptidoglycan biosynthesis protein MviN/MurJ (putative lipid II flippase)